MRLLWVIVFCLDVSRRASAEGPSEPVDCEVFSGATEEILVPLPGAKWRLPLRVSSQSYRPIFEEENGKFVRLDYGYRLLQAIHHARIQPRRILLLGTGCGWDSIWLARRFTAAEVVATDIVRASILLARLNAQMNGVADRITYRVADLFNGIEGAFDLIVFNAPRAIFNEETPAWMGLDYQRYGSPESARAYAERNYISMLERAADRPDLFDSQGFLLKRFLEGARSHLSADGNIFIMSNKFVPARFVPAGLSGRRVSALYHWSGTYRLDESHNDAFAIHRFSREGH